MAENKEKKVLNVPNIRFKEFEEEWEECRLGEIGKLYKGVGISKDQLSDNGEPCILYGELYTKYKSEVINEVVSKTNISDNKLVRSNANDVIIPCSGETAEDIATARCVLNDNVLLGGDLNIIRLHKDNGLFMSYQLNGKRKYDIARVSQGVSVVHLYGEHLKGIKTYCPNLDEQNKIATFLSLLDERIATQNKIIEELKQLKNGISLNLFTNRIIFDKQITLSKCGTLRNGYAFKSSTYNLKGKYSIITIANVTGSRYIESVDCNKVTQIPEDIQSHQILSNGDILISLTGNVGRVSLCTDGHFLLNQRVGLFELSDSIDKEFIYQVLSSKHFENEMIAKGQGAAQMNINKNDVESYVIPYSTNLQNIRIVSSLLKSLDEKILTMEHLLLSYNKQKTYLLRQMFI